MFANIYSILYFMEDCLIFSRTFEKTNSIIKKKIKKFLFDLYQQ